MSPHHHSPKKLDVHIFGPKQAKLIAQIPTWKEIKGYIDFSQRQWPMRLWHNDLHQKGLKISSFSFTNVRERLAEKAFHFCKMENYCSKIHSNYFPLSRVREQFTFKTDFLFQGEKNSCNIPFKLCKCKTSTPSLFLDKDAIGYCHRVGEMELTMA